MKGIIKATICASVDLTEELFINYNFVVKNRETTNLKDRCRTSFDNKGKNKRDNSIELEKTVLDDVSGWTLIIEKIYKM